MLKQEDIDEAVKGQTEYWGRLIEGLDYWKTSKLSRKNLDAFQTLNTLNGKPDIDWHLQPYNEGYEAFTRWRLGKTVEKHVTWTFNQVYDAILKESGDSNMAMNLAEYAAKGAELAMKARFP